MPDDQILDMPASEERPVRRAMFRGWRKKCPRCGSGPLLKGFVAVRDHCSVCGQDLTHQRAEDGPAYLTILATGHLMVPLIHIIYTQFHPRPVVMATMLSILSVMTALFLLPRFKGAMIGLQWAKRMNGFAQDQTGR